MGVASERPALAGGKVVPAETTGSSSPRRERWNRNWGRGGARPG